MRVVAGSAGGIPLFTPKTDLRPTMDMVKGAIFSSLGEWLPGKRVLDLFAGAGGLAIEALSRGCAEATFVEKDSRAVAAIQRNLEKTRLRGTVHTMDIFSYLDRVAPAGGFDLILADPPYSKQPGDRDFTAELLNAPNLLRALAPDGLFVLEHRPGSKLPLSKGWECIRQKRYGATEVAFLRRAEEEGAGEIEEE
ncbi:16S rRNA (guanine(966)-N(2))-methyltransferase RsmD [Verrucomicrobiota bacterium sgz303538]